MRRGEGGKRGKGRGGRRCNGRKGAKTGGKIFQVESFILVKYDDVWSSAAYTHTHTHCPTLMPRSSVCELVRSLSPPQTGSLLPSHSLALPLSFLPVDDVISPALSSCSHFALAKTHLPEPPCTQEHVHTLH